MIQASSLRPESTLSLSQAILKTFTRAISFIQRKRGVFFYPCRPALTDYQTHFQSGVFFYSTRARSNFLQITEKCCGGLMKFSGSPHAMRATRRLHISETQRVSMKTSISPPLLHCSFGENLPFLSVKIFNSTPQTLHAPHKLEFTIMSIP